jgi:hypothetical protein
MSVTEAQRHELFEAAKAVFGEANAETFMNLQPSVDYTQLVTKTDLADIKSEFAGVRREMADLKGDLLKTLGTWYLTGQGLMFAGIAALKLFS